MNIKAAELLSSYSGELHEKYSGRGMYGKETYAVEFDSIDQFYNTLADVIEDLVEDEDRENADIIGKVLRRLRTDNIGTGIIVY